MDAMEGKMTVVDRCLLADSLEEYRFFTQKISTITDTIEKYLSEYFLEEYLLLQEMPGISKQVAAVILSEIGPNIEAFNTAGHLASWSGLAPGSYESARKSKSSHTTQGNKYVKSALFVAGGTAGRSKDEAFNSLYSRVSSRGSKMKAIIACTHKLLRIIYKILSEKVHYDKKSTWSAATVPSATLKN